MNNNKYQVYTCLERPFTDEELDIATWPEFIYHDTVALKYWRKIYQTFPEYQFAIYENNQVVGYGNMVPLYIDEDKTQYEDRGWDWALEQSFKDVDSKKCCNTLCGLQIMINPLFAGSGYSRIFIEVMKGIAVKQGFNRVILPIRPTFKHQYPLIKLEHYIEWKNDKGEVFDPWIRTHIKSGAVIRNICFHAMSMKGSCQEWSNWTNLSFQSSGQYIVKGALVPVMANIENDIVEYHEPNLWVEYRF